MQLKTLFRSTAAKAELANARQARYAIWRKASRAAAASYRTWSDAGGGERDPAYESYLRALEREEYAARAYQQLVEQVTAEMR